MIYQIISAYFEDNCADEPTLGPVFNAIIDKMSGITAYIIKIFQPNIGRYSYTSWMTLIEVLGISSIALLRWSNRRSAESRIT